MSNARTPQTIAAHLRTIIAPELNSLPGGQALTRVVIGCAVTLETIDLYAIARTLTDERAQAAEGRPRDSDGGSSGSTPSVSSTTDDTATELVRLRDIGLNLREAIDRLHPDPDWPTIASGWRHRQSTATEHLAMMIDDVRAGDATYSDLTDAVENLCIATTHVRDCARRAQNARAWPVRQPGGPVQDVNPPAPNEAYEAMVRAARCSGWPQGLDKDGERICQNFTTEHGHRHPIDGTAMHGDLCDTCVRMLCEGCYSRVRRTPGAKDCMACEIRSRRARAA